MNPTQFQLQCLTTQQRRLLSQINTKEREISIATSNDRRFFDPDYLCHETYVIRKSKKREYINLACSFDIETSSFKEGDEKRACMYAFVFGVNGKVIFGRTWSDFIECLEALQKAYDLSDKRILPVYIHNESYEFQFICRRLNWLDIFATDERKPIRALCDYGIEFRDSYILSGMGLEKTAENLTKYKIKKLKGALDYSKLRHSTTKMTMKEWHYLENDGLSLMAFVQEEIEKNNNNVTNIPMTKTGYVRKYQKNQCYHNGQAGHGVRRKNKTRSYSEYRKVMNLLTLTKDEYILAVEAFQGGFTHANSFNVGLIYKDVSSMDLTSAYPAAIVLERNYPMGTGTYVAHPSKEKVLECLKLYACIFRIKIWGLHSKMIGDSFLSYSKCRNCLGVEKDNGRILEADYVESSITNVDLEILRAFYTFDKIEIFDLWYYPRGFLPRNFIKGVLGLYADKSTLKGVEGKEAEYLIKKEMLNSCYGMMVTSLEQATNTYKDGVWSRELPNLDETLQKYNTTSNRFISYLWGIFVTANVRMIIAKTIATELKDDYLYADTDSVKFINYGKHKKYFDDFNASIRAKIAYSSRFNQLDVNLYMPRTIEGVEKPIGVFDNEGGEDGICYKRFKTLGSKRYFVQYPKPHKMKTNDGKTIMTEYSLTISGVNKKTAIPALVEKSISEKRDIFDYFDIGLNFDENMAGKQTHTYCDYEISGRVKDFRGKWGEYHELSFIHLEATTYKLTTTDEYYEMIYMEEMQRITRRITMKI